jgi:hypothetical protein
MEPAPEVSNGNLKVRGFEKENSTPAPSEPGFRKSYCDALPDLISKSAVKLKCQDAYARVSTNLKPTIF